MSRPARLALVAAAIVAASALPGAAVPRREAMTTRVQQACHRAADGRRDVPWIVRRICGEVPRLSSASVPDREAVALLREWAFRNIDVIDVSEVARFVSPDAWRMSARGYFERFDANEAGALCGDAAWTLLRIYDAFGFESFVYNFGFADTGATHVTTVVRVDGRLVVQDAYFDFELRSDSGELLDIGDVLGRLRTGAYETVQRVEEQPFPERDYLLTEALYREKRSDAGYRERVVSPEQMSDCERTAGGYFRCRVEGFRWSRVQYHPSFGPATLERLALAGWPMELEYLMMFHLGVTSSEDGWTPVERIEESTPAAALLRDIHTAIGLET